MANELMNIFGQMQSTKQFDEIKIAIA